MSHTFAKRTTTLGAALVLLQFAPTVTQAAELFGPSRYLAYKSTLPGLAVSPFSSKKFTWVHLEDFERPASYGTKRVALSVPGVKIDEADETNLPVGYGESVDADDDVINGTGSARSLSTHYTTDTFTFRFSAKKLGHLPTHAGIVWTNVGRNKGAAAVAGDYTGNVVFQAYDAAGKSLGKIGPGLVGDGNKDQRSDEDRFFGVINSEGISAIRISMPGKNNWQVDHLQYGYIESKAVKLSGDLAFGPIALGSGAYHSLTIRSTGNAPLRVKSLGFPTGFSGDWSGVIEAGAEKVIPIKFVPKQTGPYAGAISVFCDATKGAKKIPVSGEGVSSILPFPGLRQFARP